MITFYNSKPDSTGACAQFRYNQNDQKVWLNIIKQDSWNADKHVGSFKGDKLNISLDANELGELLHAIYHRDTWSFYHKFEKNSSSGQFGYWEQKKDDKVVRRYGLSVKSTKDGEGTKEAKVGFTAGNAYNLAEWIKTVLSMLHADNVAEDERRTQEYFAKKGSGNTTTSSKTKPEAQETVSVTAESDNVPW